MRARRLFSRCIWDKKRHRLRWRQAGARKPSAGERRWREELNEPSLRKMGAGKQCKKPRPCPEIKLDTNIITTGTTLC